MMLMIAADMRRDTFLFAKVSIKSSFAKMPICGKAWRNINVSQKLPD